MISEELNQAIEHAKSGKKGQALLEFAGVLKKDPANETAWLWLAFCVDNDKKRIDCLNRALQINPRNSQTRKALYDLQFKPNSKIPLTQPSSTDNTEIPNSRIPFIQPSTTDNTEISSKSNGVLTPDKVDHEEEVRTKQVIWGKKKKGKQRENPNQRINSYVHKKRKKKSNSQKKQEKDSSVHVRIKFKSPEIFHADPTDNFFFGFTEGVKPVSRLESGLYGRTVIVDGLRIRPYDVPVCLQIGYADNERTCESCEFFSPLNCLLKYDEFLVPELNKLTAIRLTQQAHVIRRNRNIAGIIFNELRDHGRPLHFAIIAKIVKDRYPKFNITEKSVYHNILWHPELFERVDAGVYRAK